MGMGEGGTMVQWCGAFMVARYEHRILNLIKSAEDSGDRECERM